MVSIINIDIDPSLHAGLRIFDEYMCLLLHFSHRVGL